MTRIAGFRLVLLFLFASVPAVAVEPQADPAAARSATENAQVATRIEGLIRQLGDEQFQVREEASRHLAELGNRARTALEQATKNDDAEIASRAKALLDSLPKLTHTVVDALGQPIPFASVTVRFPDADSRPPLPESSEQDGRIAIPEVAPEAGRPTVVVDHADYGMAAIQVDPRSENTTLRLPLVRHGSEAHKRAIQGQVVSQDGKPVSGAVIECRDVRTPGEGLIEGVVGCGHALSDDAGRFTYYMPPSEQRRSERGTLIPANSRYALRITVPGYEAYFPWVGRYSNLGPVRIELPRATKFHRFRFEAVGGDWLGSEHLEHVRIQQERFEDGKRVLIDLGTEVVSAGRKLIPGKYVAESFANGKMVEYLPLVVTEDSPEELTFELPHAVTYHGRVIDGIHTGEGFSMPPASYGERAFIVSNAGRFFSIFVEPPI